MGGGIFRNNGMTYKLVICYARNSGVDLVISAKLLKIDEEALSEIYTDCSYP